MKRNPHTSVLSEKTEDIEDDRHGPMTKFTKNTLDLVTVMEEDLNSFRKTQQDLDEGSHQSMEYSCNENVDQTPFEYDQSKNYDKDDDSNWEDYKEILEAHYEELYDTKSFLKRSWRCIVFLVIFSLIVAVCAVVLADSNKKESNDIYSLDTKRIAPIIPSAPLNIDAVCSEDNTSTQRGWARCFAICKLAECCQIPIGLDSSCAETNNEICLGYHEPCRVIYDSAYGDSVKSKYDTGSRFDVLPAPRDLAAICSPNNVATTEGFVQCQNICSHSNCCKAPTFIGNCLKDNVDTCLEYAPCSILNDDRIDSLFVRRLCTFHRLRTIKGENLCRSACSVAACCMPDKFGGGLESCHTEQKSDWCSEFIRCESLKDIEDSQVTVSNPSLSLP